MTGSSASLRRAGFEIAAASFIVLFQELAFIRWLPVQVRVIAYFPNLILISSFLGLGIGALRGHKKSMLWLWPLTLVLVVGVAISLSNIAFTADTVDRTPMALVVMGDLMEAGVPSGRAMEVMQEALVRTTGEEGLLDVPTALRRLVREGALAPDAARQVLRAMRDGVPLRRVRHDRRPPRSDRRPNARPVPQGSDPKRVRPGG